MIASREERNQKVYSEAILWTQSSRKRDFIIWTDAKNNSGRTFDKSRIESIYKNAAQKDQDYRGKKKTKKTFSPALYDLTALQREANQRYGYSAKQTLNIMQRLYENHKVLTLPSDRFTLISPPI